MNKRNLFQRDVLLSILSRCCAMFASVYFKLLFNFMNEWSKNEKQNLKKSSKPQRTMLCDLSRPLNLLFVFRTLLCVPSQFLFIVSVGRFFFQLLQDTRHDVGVLALKPRSNEEIRRATSKLTWSLNLFACGLGLK